MYFNNSGDSETIPFAWLSIADTILEHNSAYSQCQFYCSGTELTYGGAVYAGTALYSLTLQSVTMVNNSAHLGGALYVSGHYGINITNCDFQDNIGALHQSPDSSLCTLFTAPAQLVHGTETTSEWNVGTFGHLLHVQLQHDTCCVSVYTIPSGQQVKLLVPSQA